MTAARQLVFLVGLLGTTAAMVAFRSFDVLPTGAGMLVAYLWMVVWTAAFRHQLGDRPSESSRWGGDPSLRPSRPAEVATGAGWGVVLFVLGGLGYAVSGALGLPVAPPAGRAGPPLVLAVGFCAAAVAEEFAFRGLLQRSLVRTWGPRVGVLIQSAAFSAFHLAAGQVLSTFLWGLGLGWISLHDGHLRRVITAHLVINLAGLLLFLTTR